MTAREILRHRVTLPVRNPSNCIVVQLRAADIGLQLQTLEGVALFNGDARFRYDRTGIDFTRSKVNGDSDRSLAREDLPVAHGSAAAILRKLALVNIQRAVLRDGDDRLAENPSSDDEAKVGR